MEALFFDEECFLMMKCFLMTLFFDEEWNTIYVLLPPFLLERRS